MGRCHSRKISEKTELQCVDTAHRCIYIRSSYKIAVQSWQENFLVFHRMSASLYRPRLVLILKCIIIIVIFCHWTDLVGCINGLNEIIIGNYLWKHGGKVCTAHQVATTSRIDYNRIGCALFGVNCHSTKLGTFKCQNDIILLLKISWPIEMRVDCMLHVIVVHRRHLQNDTAMLINDIFN